MAGKNQYPAQTVSTHSRPKAAGMNSLDALVDIVSVSTHSRPKAAGKIDVKNITGKKVSTHSRPKAAGARADRYRYAVLFQHTAARRRLGRRKAAVARLDWFQHTAARRRLVAAFALGRLRGMIGFNTQPPEGGWHIIWRSIPA